MSSPEEVLKAFENMSTAADKFELNPDQPKVEVESAFKAAEPKIKPKIAPKVSPQAQTTSAGVFDTAPKTKAQGLDFSKLVEADVYNLDVPIQAIEHALPEHLEVSLSDSNYVARWVQISNQRVGTLRSLGYTFVTVEDLAEDLKIQVEPDENGQLKYIDVVLMKCPKDKYYGKLRSNYQRSLLNVSQKGVHSREQNRVRSLMEEADPEAYAGAISENRLGIF